VSVLERRIKGADDAVALLRELVGDDPVDGLVVVGLDREQRLCGVGLNPRHRALSWVKVWELADLAAELGACALVVGVLPSGVSRAPSRHEVESFLDLYQRLKPAQVLLLDCIVVRGSQWWSLRERSGKFPKSGNSLLSDVAPDG
jgi:DNA repair protein RadC